mgnify:CR=1 FL=1
MLIFISLLSFMKSNITTKHKILFPYYLFKMPHIFLVIYDSLSLQCSSSIRSCIQTWITGLKIFLCAALHTPFACLFGRTGRNNNALQSIILVQFLNPRGHTAFERNSFHRRFVFGCYKFILVLDILNHQILEEKFIIIH